MLNTQEMPQQACQLQRLLATVFTIKQKKKHTAGLLALESAIYCPVCAIPCANC